MISKLFFSKQSRFHPTYYELLKFHFYEDYINAVCNQEHLLLSERLFLSVIIMYEKWMFRLLFYADWGRDDLRNVGITRHQEL
jgi:hypothetical protein